MSYDLDALRAAVNYGVNELRGLAAYAQGEVLNGEPYTDEQAIRLLAAADAIESLFDDAALGRALRAAAAGDGPEREVMVKVILEGLGAFLSSAQLAPLAARALINHVEATNDPS